ncbi:DUF1824 family protein [Tumidithrix elongata RA019]|uniref:DUF1824 family protein n=1 Tax=Tumidithrix elongata BACA0141 TaxID=2716417 RepID=A0AAW9Q803_9CYAN|nr:DUF1824 family protein [Tumidithrix elongata RA019]
MPDHPTAQATEAILIAASDLDPNSLTEPEIVRKALLSLATASDYQIFGVCADSQIQGHLALKAYTKAFGYEVPPTIGKASQNSEHGIYIKFNPRTNLCHEDTYSGKYRGVLVSYQSDFADGHCGTYGHFPLDLFHL